MLHFDDNAAIDADLSRASRWRSNPCDLDVYETELIGELLRMASFEYSDRWRPAQDRGWPGAMGPPSSAVQYPGSNGWTFLSALTASRIQSGTPTSHLAAPGNPDSPI